MQLQLCRKTGAITGLRWKQPDAGASSSGSNDDSSSSSTMSSTASSSGWSAGWGGLLSKLHLPASLSLLGGAFKSSQRQHQEGALDSDSLYGSSWASFDAPLALPVYST